MNKKQTELRKQLESLSDEELESLLAQVPGETPTQSAEVQSKSELSETLKSIIVRQKTERDRRNAATDGEFWAQLIFQSKDQRDKFFQGIAASHLLEDQWVDGVALANHLQIAIPEPPLLSIGKPNSAWSEFVG